MSVRTLLIATAAVCCQLTPVAPWDTSAIADDEAEPSFEMPKVIVRPVQRVAAETAPVAPPPAPPIDAPAQDPAAVAPPAEFVPPGGCVNASGACGPHGWQGDGSVVYADGGWCEAAWACNDRTFKEECKYYWSKWHAPCRSTCDMPPHFAYYPQYHGYYYFRPYNWEHVWMHQTLAPMLGEAPHTPYATTAFEPIYAQLPPEALPDRQTLPLTPGLEHRLPSLEDLLRAPEEESSPMP